MHNWIKAEQLGRLSAAGSPPGSEQMEVARLRAALARENGAPYPGRGDGVRGEAPGTLCPPATGSAGTIGGCGRQQDWLAGRRKHRGHTSADRVQVP